MSRSSPAGPGGRPASRIRYQPNERPPPLLSLGLAFQTMLVQVGGIVLTPLIVVRAAGSAVPDGYLNWALFAALVVSGVSTVLQVRGVGRLGARHSLTMGTSGAFIGVSVAALVTGGPALLAALVLVSALFQFLIAFRLSWLRRILTPTVAGVVLMLIAVPVMPILFGMITDVPEAAPPWAATVTFLVTLATVAGFAIRGGRSLHPWSVGLGLVAGGITAGWFGIFDLASVGEAGWLRLLPAGWPGVDASLGAEFWALLPAFVFVTLVGAIETLGDAIAIQRVSWRDRRVADYRVVEGAVAADGAGNLLSGLAGTVPNTTYSTSVSITELTGVASRRVGVLVGVILAALAFFPKFTAFFVAIPNPVIAALGLFLIAILFTTGFRLVASDGMSMPKAVIVGVSFWLGSAFHARMVFPGEFDGMVGSLLSDGMTAGGLTALALVFFSEWTGPRPRRLSMPLDAGAGPGIVELLTAVSTRRRWDAGSSARLVAAAEEALLTLLDESEDRGGARRLRFTVRAGRGSAQLEFVAAGGGENIEDRLALLSDQPEAPEESELSLRLLRHYASSVEHRKYTDLDILTVHVEAGR